MTGITGVEPSFSILIEKERERHRRPSPLFAGSTLGLYGGFQRGIAERAGWWTTCHERGRMMIAGPSMCNSYQQLLFEDGWKVYVYIIYIYHYLYLVLSFPGLRALEALEVATFPVRFPTLPPSPGGHGAADRPGFVAAHVARPGQDATRQLRGDGGIGPEASTKVLGVFIILVNQI